MGCQLKGVELLCSSSDVQVKIFNPFLSKELVQSYDCLNSFLLSFSDCRVQRWPVVIVFCINFSPIKNKKLSYRGASLRILGEHCHHEMKRSVAFVVSLINICIIHDQLLHDPNLYLHNCQVQRWPIDSSAKINIHLYIYQDHRSFKIVFSNCKAKRSAVVFVKQVWIRLSFQ